MPILPARESGQHDVGPGLTSGAPGTQPVIVMIAITITLTIIATIKANQDLKRTKRLWKMCLKLLCLSMAVDGSIARLPNICKDFRFHNVHHSQS